METNTLLSLRNFFLRTFLVGLLLIIVVAVATLGLQSVWMPLLTRGFNLAEEEVSKVMLSSLLNFRIVLLLTLAPGLALHWMTQGKK